MFVCFKFALNYIAKLYYPKLLFLSLLHFRFFSNVLMKYRHGSNCLGCQSKLYLAAKDAISDFKKCTAVDSVRACVFQDQVRPIRIANTLCKEEIQSKTSK